MEGLFGTTIAFILSAILTIGPYSLMPSATEYISIFSYFLNVQGPNLSQM
jgi:hypothetical protein